MNQISNPADRKKIKDALIEISNSMLRIEAERDLIKEIVQTVSDEHDIPKKYVNKMGKLYHKQSFYNEQQQNDELATLYETVVAGEKQV